MRLPPDIEVDPVTRTLAVCGRKLFVALADYAPFEPAHGPSTDPETVRWWNEMMGHGPPDHPYDEVARIHADVLVGENGWWIDLSIWEEEVPEITWSRPDLFEPETLYTGAELLIVLDEAARWPGPPERHWRGEMTEYDEPGGGGWATGTWTGFEDWS